MGLFRTVPVDVEAIQYVGMANDEPIFNEMGNSVPSWLWKGITRGKVSFDSAGLKVNGNTIQASSWIVFDGAFIDVMSAEKFERTFVPARKPLEKMLSAPKPINIRKARAIVPVSTPQPEGDVNEERIVQSDGDAIPGFAATATAYPGAVAVSINPQPATLDDEVDAIMNKIGAQ